MRAQSQKHVLTNQQEYRFAIITKPGVMLNDMLTVHLYHVWKLIRLLCTYSMSCDTGFQHPRCYPTVQYMKSIRKNIFIYCLNGTLLMNVARKWYNSPKIRTLWLSQNGALMSISMLSTKSVPNLKSLQCTNLKAAQCKIPPGMLKTPKPEIGSVCTIWPAMLGCLTTAI